ncbi:MAG: NUDIX hydrolase [Pseudomonadota bacterium]
MADDLKSDGVRLPADFDFKIPDADDRERLVCKRCTWIHYVNPRIVVGSVCEWQGLILMCRRNIEPRRGFWTIPAGFLEEQESAEHGATREAHEEACADIEIDRLLAIYSIPRISQVQLMYRARLKSPDVAAGPESQEVALVAPKDIPWAELAFPSVTWVLRHHAAVRGRADFPPFSNPEDDTGDVLPG